MHHMPPVLTLPGARFGRVHFLPPIDLAKRQCLSAFIVALSQTGKRGEKGWMSSTLELQLASLDFCRACRSVPTLRVSVDPQTPCSIWLAPKARAAPHTRSSKEDCISSRIPVVQAVSLTWQLPLEALVKSADKDLWTWGGLSEPQGLCVCT